MELLGVDSQIWIAHHEFVFDWQLWAPRLLNIVITLARVVPETAREAVKLRRWSVRVHMWGKQLCNCNSLQAPLSCRHPRDWTWGCKFQIHIGQVHPDVNTDGPDWQVEVRSIAD